MNFFSSPPNNVLSGLQHQEATTAPWALVTGATSSIGLEIAEELARRGLNLIVHGRRNARLVALSQQLSKKYSCQMKTFCFDASVALRPGSETWKLMDEWKDLNLKVLVNNVGTGHDPSGFAPFINSTPEAITTLLETNVGFMTRLTHALLPILRSTASPTSPSFIINAGSLADMGLPYISVYSGTKAYIRAFSTSLDAELLLEEAHVRVVASIIGDTDSDGHKVGTGVLTPDSKTMAALIVDSAARSAGGPTTPHWGHWFQEWLVWVQPYRLRRLGIMTHFRAMMAEKKHV